MPEATPSLPSEFETRRVLVFIAFAFGIAWLTALALYLTGGLGNSMVLVEGTPITLAAVLLPTAYMFSPAAANLASRFLTNEGFSDLRLRPGSELRVYAAAWFLPPVLAVVGGLAYFLLHPGQFGFVQDALPSSGLPFEPWVSLVVVVASVVFIAPLINTVFAFGEEFGWRAYLLQKLMPLGFGRAVALLGVVWGVWHWPLIVLGYNYGTGYVGAPWTGFLAMTWFTFVVGVFLAWLALRDGSVWPAALAHGAVNASGGLALLFVAAEPRLLLGPLPVGVLGSVGWVAVAAWILLRKPWR